MKKLLLIFGVIGVLTIMFLDTKIEPKLMVQDTVSTIMDKVDFTKRTLTLFDDVEVKAQDNNDEINVDVDIEITQQKEEEKERVIIIEKYTHSSQTARVLDKESVEVYVQPLMQIGNQGEYVSELQEMLNDKGYDIAVDGIFGVETQEAVEAFQTDAGIQIDGVVGIETWGELLDL